jgi:hypothetical protein
VAVGADATGEGEKAGGKTQQGEWAHRPAPHLDDPSNPRFRGEGQAAVVAAARIERYKPARGIGGETAHDTSKTG